MQSSLALLGLVLLLLSPCARANYRCHAFGNGVRLDVNGSSKYAAMCIDDSYDLFYKDTRVERNMAVCETDKESSEGWRTVAWPGESNFKERVLVRDSETPAQFECMKAPTPCTYHPAEWLLFDEATKSLTCTNSDNTLRAIKSAQAVGERWPTSKGLFASLRCGRQGRSDVWKANAEYEWKEAVGKYIAEASPTLNVTCEEYCVPSGDGLAVHKYGNLIEVTCADPTVDLSYDGHFRNNVRCSLEKGWTDGDKTITTNAKSELGLKCTKACTFQQPESTTGIHFDNSSKSYSCSNDDSHILNLITVYSQSRNSIKCDKLNGWRSGNDNIAKAYGPLNAACVKYCSWSGIGIVANRTSNGLELSCADPGFGVEWSTKDQLRRSTKLAKSLKCNATSRTTEDTSLWESERKLIGQEAHMELKCERYPHSCDLPSVEGFKYDKEAKRLTCTGGDGIRVIELNSLRFSFFRCDEIDGWTGQESRFSETKPFDGSPLNGKCVEYCAATGEGVHVYPVVDRLISVTYRISVTCPDQGQLFYDNIRAEYDEVECNTEGWRGYGVERYKGQHKLNLSHTSPAHFECRPAPTTARPDNRLKVWRSSATEEPLANAEAQTLTIICASIGGIVLIIIVLIIVICVLKCQRRPDSGEIRTNIASDQSEKRDRSYNDVARSARSER